MEKTRRSKKGATNAESEASFYAESIAKFGDVFSFGSNGVTFKNWAKPIGITCNICVEKHPDDCTWMYITPTQHMSRGCLNCKKELREKIPKERTDKQKANDAKKREIAIQNFIKNAPKKQNCRYDYDNDSFKYEIRINASGRYRGYITVYCWMHDYEFFQWASDHLDGKIGCGDCERDAKRMVLAKTPEQFVIDAKTMKEHEGKYEYPFIDTEYVNAKSKITIYCKTCDKNFPKIAGDHLDNARGCTLCSPNKSWGERTIYEFLDSHNIAFEDEFSFLGDRRRYDFLLTEYKIFIEYDGRQHFNFTKIWHITEEGFNDEQITDVKKTVKVIQAGYKMIRIDYLIETPVDIANVINIAIERRNEYDMFVTSHLYDKMVNSVRPMISADSIIIMMNVDDTF